MVILTHQVLSNGDSSATVAMPHKPVVGTDQRHLPRRRMLKQANVILSDATSITCIVRDLSKNGARLVFGGPIALPPTFRVEFSCSREMRLVDLIWNRGFAAGVSFRQAEIAANGQQVSGAHQG